MHCSVQHSGFKKPFVAAFYMEVSPITLQHLATTRIHGFPLHWQGNWTCLQLCPEKQTKLLISELPATSLPRTLPSLGFQDGKGSRTGHSGPTQVTEIDASDKVWNSLSSTDPLWSASRVLYLSWGGKGLQRLSKIQRPKKLLTTNWYVAIVSWSLCMNHEAQESALNKQNHIQRSYRHLIQLTQFFLSNYQPASAPNRNTNYLCIFAPRYHRSA